MSKTVTKKPRNVTIPPPALPGPKRPKCVYPLVEQIMIENRLSFNHVARLSSYSAGYVCNVLKGESELTQKFIARLAPVFGYEDDPDALFAGGPK